MQNISIKRKIANFTGDMIANLLGLKNPNKLTSIMLERIKPQVKLQTQYGTINYHCPNELIWWRVSTFKTKEPDTIQWIDQMDKNDILCDIGANIGIFSLYAAKKGLKVIAFEPEALNFSELSQNAALNNFTNLILFNLAISERNELISFKMKSPHAGSANHEVKQIKGEIKEDYIKQTVQGISLDQLITNGSIPCPNHIKIDVDGLEFEIVKGLKETLNNKILKSILIEIDENLPTASEIIKLIKDAGFRINSQSNYTYKINNFIFIRN